MAKELEATNNQKGVQAKWTSIETDKLLDYLHGHHSELKDVKSIKYKWGILRNHCSVICNWHRLSGVHWDNFTATMVFETFLCAKRYASAIMENYQTTGWKYLEKMEDIFPEGGTTGTQAFCGGATSTLPGTSDAVSHESDHPSIAFMSGSTDQQCHYIHHHCYQFPHPFRLIILVWAYPVKLYSIKLS
ncbi:hypothetical protein J3A83DRAFT_4273217 [Scleroderma citrinum]